MTDLAWGSISMTALTAWQFSPPLFTPPSQAPFNPPPSLVVNISETWSHPLFLIHGEDGCWGVGHPGSPAGVPFVHAWYNQNTWPLNHQIYLGVLAAQQYWGK
jgi:hypothetical protein